MSTDSQGRPLSDDGQWAWSGTEWVPAAGGEIPADATGAGAPQAPDHGAAGDPDDVGATRIIQSPLAGASSAGETYVGVPPADQTAVAGSPAAAAAAAPTGDTPQGPGWDTVPKAPKNSRKTVIALIVGVLVIAAVVIILVFTLGGGGNKGPSGAFKCTTPNVSGSGTITFTSSTDYTLSDGGKGGKYSYSDNKLLFTSGSLANTTTTYRGKTFQLTVQGQNLTCKQ